SIRWRPSSTQRPLLRRSCDEVARRATSRRRSLFRLSTRKYRDDQPKVGSETTFDQHRPRRHVRLRKPCLTLLSFCGFLHARADALDLEEYFVVADHAELGARALLDRLVARLEVANVRVERVVARLELRVRVAL